MLANVRSNQWNRSCGTLSFRDPVEGSLSVSEVLQLVDTIAALPPISTLGDLYDGDRGWIMVHTDECILHAYIDEAVRIEYFRVDQPDDETPNDGSRLFGRIDVESLKQVLVLLDESKPIEDFLREQFRTFSVYLTDLV